MKPTTSGITASVLGELKEIVGPEHASSAADDIAASSQDIGPWRTLGAAIVQPKTTDEVAAIVRLADREGIPIWTFSGGWNWGYGAAMGLEDGAIILLLRRMNRILEVNTELAYAVVEPGVTQQQLRDYLDEHETGLWTDCTDSTPHGSVIGNALEHGVGYTPLCDHFGALCGVEAVLADGTVVKSGGGPEHSTTWNVHRWGTGPSVQGLFGQSNLGIVTRAGVWLMPKPEAYKLFLIELRDEACLAEVVDIFRDLTLRGILSANLHIVNDVLFTAILQQYPRDLLGKGETRLSDSALAKLRARLRLTPVAVTTGLYGTRSSVREQQELLKRRLKSFGRISIVGSELAGRIPRLARFWEKKGTHGSLLDGVLAKLSGATPAKLRATESVFRLLQGIPGELVLGFAYFKAAIKRPTQDLDPARDGAGMIWFPVILPLTGHHVQAVIDLCRPVFHKHGFDYANTFISISARATMSLMPIFYDKADPDETQRAQDLQRELFELTQKAGYPQYRTGHAFHRTVFEDAPGYSGMMQRIKKALDPKGILAPGRYGMGGQD